MMEMIYLRENVNSFVQAMLNRDEKVESESTDEKEELL